MPSRPVRSPHAMVLATMSVAAIALACSPTASPSPSVSLVDTSWTVASINGADVVPARPPTMTFSADGQVSGSSGCNQYTASYQTDGNKLTVGSIASTLMLCDGAVGAQEVAFTSGLGGAATWQVNATGDLDIDGSARIVAKTGVAQSAPPPSPGAALGGTAWNLAEMGGTADFAHIVPTIEFGADGSVSGFAGCNTYRGTFTTDGSTLTLSPLAATKIGCQRPASVVEADYLNALSGVTSWEIDGAGQLTLGGAVLLRFSSR
jgi:heat shock protein HslJ